MLVIGSEQLCNLTASAIFRHLTCLFLCPLRYSTSKKGENSWPAYDSETQAEVHRGVSCQRKTFQRGQIRMLRETGKKEGEG